MVSEEQTERRRDPRFPVRLRCWIQRESLTLLGVALNISRGGLFVRTPPGLEPGSAVSLEVGGDDGAFEAHGRVVWTADPDGSGSGMPGIGVLLTEVISGLERFQRLLEQQGETDLAD